MTPVLCPVLRPSSPPSSTLPLCLCTRVSSWSGEYLKSHGASVRTASQQHNPDASFYSIRSYNLQFCCLSCLRLSFLSLFFLINLFFLYFVCRYATIYTMFPVFSLVLDQDVKPEMALLYPELYKDLTKV